MKTISLVPRVDRYIWSLENDGSFSVASIRKTLDDNRFQEESLSTRWVKSVPIKVNILAWKVKSNALPTRFNISRRGMDIDSIDCPICKMGVETTSHVFFQCNVVRQVMRKISSWWNVEYMEVNSYEEWRSWLVSTRIRSNIKVIIEGAIGVRIKEETQLIESLLLLAVGIGVLQVIEKASVDRFIHGGQSSSSNHKQSVWTHNAASLSSVMTTPCSTSVTPTPTAYICSCGRIRTAEPWKQLTRRVRNMCINSLTNDMNLFVLANKEPKELTQLKREAMLKRGFYVNPGAKILFIIRIREPSSAQIL
ncbi:RNA-directed DNA polymerase, eukaryota [Tanacetum coccineum]